MTMPATRVATSESDWRLARVLVCSAAREAVAVSRAAVSSSMRGVTVASDALPFVPSAAAKKASQSQRPIRLGNTGRGH